MTVTASALVAGGGSGLGAATAALLRERGCAVAVLDRRLPGGAASGGLTVEGDVRDAAAVQAAVDAAVAVAPLRAVVCCAGISRSERLVGREAVHDLARFEEAVAINVTGTFNVLRLAAAAMAANDPDEEGERGVAVTTASIAAFDPMLGQTAYGASKGAVAALTLAAARDLAGLGIRVCSIAPGVFDTPLFARHSAEFKAGLAAQVPFPSRLGRPEEYARLVGTILDQRMLNGAVIRLDGALRMPPR